MATKRATKPETTAAARKAHNKKVMAAARAAIFKGTKQKPIKPSDTELPHLSTGSLSVNMLIGGTPAADGKPICPGFPRRRLTEVYGPESSGKTTLLLQSIVEAQKGGGMAMFIDFEHALDLAYAKAVGVSFDEDCWQFYQPTTMEEGLKMAYVGIVLGVDIVGIDSIAGMVPAAELKKSLDDAAKIGVVAAKLARDLPKFVMWLMKHPMDQISKKSIEDHPGTALVVLNQTRALISTSGGGHGDNENTSGGKALKFFAYLRLRLQRIKSEFVERKDPITGKKRRYPFGNVTIVKVVKSKVDAKQGHSTNIFIRYGYGIDDYLSIIEAGVTYKIIKKNGPMFNYGAHTFKGKEAFRKFLMTPDGEKVFFEIKDKLVPLIGGSADPAATAENMTDEDLILEQMAEDGMGEDDEDDDEDLGEEMDEALSDISLDDPEPEDDDN